MARKRIQIRPLPPLPAQSGDRSFVGSGRQLLHVETDSLANSVAAEDVLTFVFPPGFFGNKTVISYEAVLRHNAGSNSVTTTLSINGTVITTITQSTANGRIVLYSRIAAKGRDTLVNLGSMFGSSNLHTEQDVPVTVDLDNAQIEMTLRIAGVAANDLSHILSILEQVN